MKDAHRLTVIVEFFFNPYDGLPDPRKLDEFKSAISILKDIFSCNSIMYYDEIYTREDFNKEEFLNDF